jgi:hypothetical protein
MFGVKQSSAAAVGDIPQRKAARNGHSLPPSLGTSKDKKTARNGWHLLTT